LYFDFLQIFSEPFLVTLGCGFELIFPSLILLAKGELFLSTSFCPFCSAVHRSNLANLLKKLNKTTKQTTHFKFYFPGKVAAIFYNLFHFSHSFPKLINFGEKEERRKIEKMDESHNLNLRFYKPFQEVSKHAIEGKFTSLVFHDEIALAFQRKRVCR
jgi:hypothetical protein